MNTPPARTVALVFAIIFPTIVTWIYFDLLADSPIKMVAYPVGKAIQFGFPLVWVWLGERQRAKHAGLAQLGGVPSWSTRASLAIGATAGIGVVAMMFGVFHLLPVEILQELVSEVRERVEGFSVNSPEKFAGLAIFYAIVHSFMEEYYFRWFVFGQLRQTVAFIPAMLVSGLAFMAHHVIVLNHYFEGQPGWTVFLSLSIAVGGWMWAYQYEKSRSLIGPWVSHAAVDAGIFLLGYRMLFS